MFKEMPLWEKIIFAVLLLLPLALALVWLYYLNLATQIPGAAGTFLSPMNSKPLITGLIIFTAGYSAFLLIMFYSNIKEVIEHTFHKEE